jgi:hypothetical protein
MSIGNLGEPRWAQYDEYRDAESQPDGREDVFNRAPKDFFTSLTVAHDYSTGAHAETGCMEFETGSYSGDSNDNRNIALTNTGLTIVFILIWRDDTETPVVRTADMTGDNTKQAGTAAFQTDMIQSIATTGQFQVGTDAAVNATGVTYRYFVMGEIT